MFAVASSTRGAIIPRIVPTELVPAANTLNYTVGTFGGVVGPLIAGIVVSLGHGFAYAYAIDAALFLAALYTALSLRPRTRCRRRPRRSLRWCALAVPSFWRYSTHAIDR
jgi:MFS family permease